MTHPKPAFVPRPAANAEAETPESLEPVGPALYGEAAAIYAMYQADLLERTPKAAPSRRPGPPRRGILARWFDSVRPTLRVPAFARA